MSRLDRRGHLGRLGRLGPIPVRVLEPLVVVAAFVAAAPFLAALWQRLWTPSTGVVYRSKYYEGYRIEGNVLGADYRGMRSSFDGVAWFVVVGFVGCLLLGVLCALLARRSPLLTLAAVAVGSVAASWVAYRFGVHLGPSDPRQLAAHAGDGTVLPSRLSVKGHTPFAVWPLGALVGLAVTYFVAPGSPPAGSRPADLGGARPGQPDQVGRGQLDVEAAPPG